MDILMNEGKGLVFKNGKFFLTENMAQSLSQRLGIRLKTLLGSWYLDRFYGIDYFNRVFEKTISKLSIDTMFTVEIKKEELVDQIISFKSVIENNTYKMDFKVRLVSGEISEKITVLVNEQGKVIVTENGFAIRIK